MADAVVKVHDWGAISASVRTRPSGKARCTVEFKSEALAVNTDPALWGAPVADALAKVLREQIAAIPQRASAATEDARKVAKTAFRKGKAWAMRRYSGGRIGAMEPDAVSPEAPRLMNDSGRFVRSLVARLTRDRSMFVLNVAVNRLDNERVRERVFAILTQWVPGFSDPRSLASDPAVRGAMLDAMAGAVTKQSAKSLADLQRALKETGARLDELGEAATAED